MVADGLWGGYELDLKHRATGCGDTVFRMEPKWSPARFLSPAFERVHGHLGRLVSDGAAHFLADACDIAQRQPPYRSGTHIVSHLIREVESATRQVLRSLPLAKSCLAEVAARTDPAGKKKGKKVGEKNDHLPEIDAILHALGLANDPIATQWRSFVHEESWFKRAHRDDLRSPRRPDEDFTERLRIFIEALAAVLDAAEANYTAVLAAIDPIVAKPEPSTGDIDAIAPHLASGVTAPAHIFERLTPAWLAPLREKGVFSDPPETRVHDDRAISFPAWPQAQYLVRIAADAPHEVVSTIESIPDTDNQGIHTAFLQTALRMPGPFAARIAMREAQWLEWNRWIDGLIPRRVQDLAVHLSNNHQVDAAVSLLKVAWSPAQQGTRQGAWDRRENRMPDWDYDRFVATTASALAAAAPEAARDLLSATIAGGDYSFGPDSIAECGQRRLAETRDCLVDELRDLYEKALRNGRWQLRDVVLGLEAKELLVFRRMALHLLSVFGEQAPDLLMERATDQALLEEIIDGTLPEGVALLSFQMPRLDSARRATVMAALRENASTGRLRSLVGMHPDHVEQCAGIRLRDWLHRLGDARSPDETTELAALCVHHGCPDENRMRPRRGPNPPLAADALLAMDDGALLGFLATWGPAANDPFEPSRDGLSRELRKCAAMAPHRFAALAPRFTGLDPRYVAGVLGGLHEAERARSTRKESDAEPLVEETIDWESTLELAAATTRPENLDAERNWDWARGAAIDISFDASCWALQKGKLATLRRAWSIVFSLMVAADPTPERAGAAKLDDVTFSINTVRGSALRGAIELAYLISREKEPDPALLREILAGLERRADATVEPAVAVRTTLAQRFDKLVATDSSTAARVAEALFAQKPGAQDSHRAWQVFLEWNQPSPVAYRLLDQHYARAVAEVDQVDPKAAESLGEHLAWLAAWECIGPGSSDPLLEDFVARAPSRARQRALNSLGRALHRSADPPPPRFIERLKVLFDWWYSAVAGQQEKGDLAAIGWWVASEAFDSDWALATLDRVLDATGGRLDWDHDVVECLAKLAPKHSDQVATCLAKLIGDSRRTSRIHLMTPAIRATLQALVGERASALGKQVANRLVARGYPEFRDLA